VACRHAAFNSGGQNPASGRIFWLADFPRAFWLADFPRIAETVLVWRASQPVRQRKSSAMQLQFVHLK
jgi:hypothetical protein